MPRNFACANNGSVSQTMILQEVLQGAGAAAESQGVNRQNGHFRVHVVARIARSFEFTFQRLTHDHPQRIARRDIVPARQHEFVAKGVLRTAVVVAQSAQLRPRQMRRHVVGRVRQWPAEMPRL